MIKLNPNCSETVVRIKHKDIGNLTSKEMNIYLYILNNTWYSDKPVQGYSDLRGTREMKAHYYYQTTGNELIAFALWLDIYYDTGEVWHSGDLMSWLEDKDYEEIKEYLSEKFTEYESLIS